jgi:hypothetical protein
MPLAIVLISRDFLTFDVWFERKMHPNRFRQNVLAICSICAIDMISGGIRTTVLRM